MTRFKGSLPWALWSLLDKPIGLAFNFIGWWNSTTLSTSPSICMELGSGRWYCDRCCIRRADRCPLYRAKSKLWAVILFKSGIVSYQCHAWITASKLCFGRLDRGRTCLRKVKKKWRKNKKTQKLIINQRIGVQIYGWFDRYTHCSSCW